MVTGFFSLIPWRASPAASSAMLTGFDPDDGHRVKQDFGLLLRDHSTDGEETYFKIINYFLVEYNGLSDHDLNLFLSQRAPSRNSPWI